ncbi:MAG: type II toxin-antitoxin system death-on-curing family toxin [Buchananella hordeovulneris]|nr:type II toxin-antitoxin system death-on-curing family toxin [Buchananella hordeovulneris]
MTTYLSLEDMVYLVEQLQVGPIRDLGLLESATRRPQAVLYGREAYPSLTQKAAALLHSTVRNHALVDGNKRLGWLGLLVFLELNGYEIDVEDDPAYNLVIAVAEDKLGVDEIAHALEKWINLATASETPEPR